MEFLGRPNTPNALAQSLVQMAAHQNDPIAEAIKTLGVQFNDVMDHKAKENAMASEQAHQVKLKQMDLDARHKENQGNLIIKLLESGQATPADTKPLTSGDAAMMLSPDFQGPLQSMGQREAPPKGSYASEKYPGADLPPGYNIQPKPLTKEAPETYPLTKEMVAKAPSLGALPLGTKIPHKDYLDAVEIEKTKNSSAADRDLQLAQKIVEKSSQGATMTPDQVTKATLDIEAKIKAHRRGEKVTFEDPPADPVERSAWEKMQSFFGSVMGGTVKAAKAVKDAATPAAKSASDNTLGSPLPGLKITKKKA